MGANQQGKQPGDGEYAGGDFGSGTPGDQGTLSGVGVQPDGGGAGLGATTTSGEEGVGDGSGQEKPEAGA